MKNIVKWCIREKARQRYHSRRLNGGLTKVKRVKIKKKQSFFIKLWNIVQSIVYYPIYNSGYNPLIKKNKNI